MYSCKMFSIADFVPFPSAATLHEDNISTYFLVTSKGCFFHGSVFVSGVAQVLIVRTNNCNLQGHRLCCKTEYIYIR